MNCFLKRVLFANSLKTTMIVNSTIREKINRNTKGENELEIACEDCPDIILSDDVSNGANELNN